MEVRLATNQKQLAIVELKIIAKLLIVLDTMIQTFDASAFTSWAKEVYIQLQAAWTKKDWNLVRSLESASLYSQHSAQLEDYIQSQTTNVLERVYVENVRIKILRKSRWK